MKNSKGQIFYGMHFYPGVAQYDTPDGSFRVFINESTIRKLNQSFAGRPVFVEHVDGVDEDLTQLRSEADGWVVESFFNESDGKTWVKFIVVSDQGFAAIRKGWRLSNAYIPQLVDSQATWNGVDYQKEVVGGEFEHLAIVSNPRYEESVIMTPDEFKAYNSKLKAELYRIANSKENKEKNKMAKFNFFKRQKIENSVDVEGMMVELPKSKKEISITQLINDHDAVLNMNGYANGDHMVKIHDSSEMSVNDLVKAYQGKCNEMDEMKKNASGEDGGEPGKGKDDLDMEVAENEALDVDQMGDVGDRGGDESLNNEDGEGEGERDDNGDKSLDNEEDEDEKPKKDKMKNAAGIAARKKIEEAKKKAARLKNAHLNARNQEEFVTIDLPEDQVARGKSRYGSAN